MIYCKQSNFIRARTRSKEKITSLKLCIVFTLISFQFILVRAEFVETRFARQIRARLLRLSITEQVGRLKTRRGAGQTRVCVFWCLNLVARGSSSSKSVSDCHARSVSQSLRFDRSFRRDRFGLAAPTSGCCSVRRLNDDLGVDFASERASD